MPFLHSRGALDAHGPGPQRVTEGLPQAERQRVKQPRVSLPRPELAAISGAACGAPVTQCYRFRAAATSGHTCTANS